MSLRLILKTERYQPYKTLIQLKEHAPSSDEHSDEVVIEDEHQRPDLEEVITGNKSDKRPINI